MRKQRAERLRFAVESLPPETQRAMLKGIQENRIVTGANTDRRGGVCPMLAADRNAFAVTPLAEIFATAWDQYTGTSFVNVNRRAASERDLRVLQTMLETSLKLSARAEPPTAVTARPAIPQPAVAELAQAQQTLTAAARLEVIRALEASGHHVPTLPAPRVAAAAASAPVASAEAPAPREPSRRETRRAPAAPPRPRDRRRPPSSGPEDRHRARAPAGPGDRRQPGVDLAQSRLATPGRPGPPGRDDPAGRSGPPVRSGAPDRSRSAGRGDPGAGAGARRPGQPAEPHAGARRPVGLGLAPGVQLLRRVRADAPGSRRDPARPRGRRRRRPARGHQAARSHSRLIRPGGVLVLASAVLVSCGGALKRSSTASPSA